MRSIPKKNLKYPLEVLEGRADQIELRDGQSLVENVHVAAIRCAEASTEAELAGGPAAILGYGRHLT